MGEPQAVRTTWRHRDEVPWIAVRAQRNAERGVVALPDPPIDLPAGLEDLRAMCAGLPSHPQEP